MTQSETKNVNSLVATGTADVTVVQTAEGETAAKTAARVARVERKTKETDITVEINLDGTGVTAINTGVPFFDHMLDAFGRHGLFDLTIEAHGDTEVDDHHTVEDVGIVLGQAIAQALGDKRGITRFASPSIPMDESLVMAAVDISGRGGFYGGLDLPFGKVGTFDTQLPQEFFVALATNAGITLHVHALTGTNVHHLIEAAFKACGRALCEACALNPRIANQLPSTKGSL